MALTTPAFAIGEGVDVAQDGQVVCFGAPRLNILGSLGLVQDIGGTCEIAPATSLIDCVGDVPEDFCATVDASNSDWTFDIVRAITGIFSGGVRIGDTANPTAGIELDVIGQAIVSSQLRVGSTSAPAAGVELDVVGNAIISTDLITPLISGGVSANGILTLQGTTNATIGRVILSDPTVVLDRNLTNIYSAPFTALTVLPSGRTLTHDANTDSLFAIGSSGSISYTGTGGTQAAQAFLASTIFHQPGANSQVFGQISTVHSAPIFQFLTFTGLSGAELYGVNHAPLIDADTSGDGTVARVAGVRFKLFFENDEVDDVVTTAAAVYMPNPTKTGTNGVITNLVGFEMDNQTAVATNKAFAWVKGDQMPIASLSGAAFGTTQTVPTGPVGGSILQVNGGLTLKRTTFSNANYTMLVSDLYLGQIGTMSAARTVTLPAAATAVAGKLYTVKDESGSVTGTNTIIVDGNSTETIDGGTTRTIGTARGSLTIFSDGANWHVTAHEGTIT